MTLLQLSAEIDKHDIEDKRRIFYDLLWEVTGLTNWGLRDAIAALEREKERRRERQASTDWQIEFKKSL